MPIYKGSGKSKDGLQRYHVRLNYIDTYGVPRQKTRVAYGLQQAKMLEMKLQSEQKEPTAMMTVQEVYLLYITAKQKELRETTVAKIEVDFRCHILSYFEDTRLSKLNVLTLNEWKRYIYEKNLQVKTNQRIYGSLRAFLNWSVKNGYLSENPINKVDNFKNAYDTPKRDKIRYYTAEQFKQYIEVALDEAKQTENYGFYVFFNIAFYTGMRKGEINALRWSDIVGGSIEVKRSIAQKLKGEDGETPPKNKSSYRTIQIPEPLAKVLEEYRERLSKLDGYSANHRVCGGDRCLRDTTIDTYNRKYASKAELPHIKIHDFRHSHATLLANAGINIQEIARRLGHSNIEETWNTYSHLYPQEEERALQVLNNL